MNDMALVPWDKIELIDNPIRAWEVWKQSFLAVANLHAPVRIIPEIKRLMWERNKIKRIAIVTGDQFMGSVQAS